MVTETVYGIFRPVEGLSQFQNHISGGGKDIEVCKGPRNHVHQKCMVYHMHVMQSLLWVHKKALRGCFNPGFKCRKTGRG